MRRFARFAGMWTRYFYYQIIGKPKKIASLSNAFKDDYDDLGNALKQDFLNAVVGAIVFIVMSVFIAWLVWG